MRKFIKNTDNDLTQSKVIETRDGMILNSTYHNKDGFTTRSFESYKIGGNQYTLSLNRVANHPINTGGNKNEWFPYRTYGDMIITDSEDDTIEYIVTHSSTLRMVSPPTNNNSTIAKIKTVDKTPELLLVSTSMPTNSLITGTLNQFLGQSKNKLYFSGNVAGEYASRMRVISVDKQTLIPSMLLENSSDLENITILRETHSLIYIIRRRNLSTSEIYAIDKFSDLVSLITTIPLLQEEVCGSTLMKPERIDDENHYIVELNSFNTIPSYRWIDFKYKEVEAPIQEEGYPNEVGLKEEASFSVISFSGYGNPTYCGLFDKKHGPDIWTDFTNFYWYNSSHYLEIKIDDKVNIWRTGVKGYATTNSALTVEKFNSETSKWSAITVPQTYTAVENNKWNKFISNLEPGTYRFKYSGNRMDSCWYIENVNGETIHTYEIDYRLENVTVENKNFELEEIEGFPGIATGLGVTRDNFCHSANGRTYFNCATYGMSDTAWNTIHLDKNIVSTFLIDMVEKKIFYKDSVRLTEAVECTKAFLTNSNNEIALSSSTNTVSIFKFDPELERYVATQRIPKGAYSLGFDINEDIWIMYRNYEVFKYGKNMPYDISVSYEGAFPVYSNEPIDLELSISAKNCFNEPISGVINLNCTDNIVLENNLTNMDIEVPEDGTVTTLKIIAPGLVVINKSIVTDLSKKQEV